MDIAYLRKYKDSLYSALSREFAEFEKNFLLISAGLLAFSITFINDIVDLEIAEWIYALFIAWLLIAVSIGLIMFSFIKSAYASDELLTMVDENLKPFANKSDNYILSSEEETLVRNSVNPIYKTSKSCLKNLRYWSIGIFLAGLFCFGAFVGINIYDKKNKKKEENSITYKLKGIEKQINLNGMKLIITDTSIIIKK